MTTVSDIKIPKVRTPAKEPVVAPAVLTGYKELAREIAAHKLLVTATANQLDVEREPLENAARVFRNGLEERGHFDKVVHVDGGQVSVEFADAYVRIDPRLEGELRAMCGKHYNDLFTTKREVTVPNSGQLLAFLDSSGFEIKVNDLVRYVIIEEYITPVAEFRLARFKLRPEMSKELNEALDEVIRQIENRPRLHVK